MQESQLNVRFDELSYTNTEYSVPDSLIRAINQEYADNRSQYDAFGETIQNAELTARNVRLVFPWCVGSIQTNTERIDQMTGFLMNGNFEDFKNFCQRTTDGQKKWSKMHEFWTSDVPEQVVKELRRGNEIEAKAVLGGLSRSGPKEYSYARPCKASLVTELLTPGDHMCLDSRRHRVLRPLLKEMLPKAIQTPDHDHPENNPYRVRPGRKHMADYKLAWTQDFLQDGLERNPQEYTAITREILDVLEANTVVPRHLISHVVFNLGGPRTFHETLQEKLD